MDLFYSNIVFYSLLFVWDYKSILAIQLKKIKNFDFYPIVVNFNVDFVIGLIYLILMIV